MRVLGWIGEPPERACMMSGGAFGVLGCKGPHQQLLRCRLNGSLTRRHEGLPLSYTFGAISRERVLEKKPRNELWNADQHRCSTYRARPSCRFRVPA